MRLLLLSGVGGSGTSTIARATALRAVADGARVRLIDLTDDREAVAARRAAHQWLGALMADVLVVRAAEQVLAEELAILPGVDEFLALAAIAESAGDTDTDLVIVDVGPIASLQRLLLIADTLDLFAASLMTPAMASARDNLDAPLADLRHELRRVRECLESRDTSVRLVCLPDDRAIPALSQALLMCSLYGVHVDLAYVNQVPRRKDSWPKSWARDRRQRAESIMAEFTNPPTRMLTMRTESSESIAERLRPVAKDLPVWTSHASRGVESVETLGSGFVWTLPLHMGATDDIRLGRADDRIIIEIGSLCRVRALPSALRRCEITRAIASPAGLRLEFAPDPSVWRGNG